MGVPESRPTSTERLTAAQPGVVGYFEFLAAGVTDRLWEVSDLVALLEAEGRRLERAG